MNILDENIIFVCGHMHIFNQKMFFTESVTVTC